MHRRPRATGRARGLAPPPRRAGMQAKAHAASLSLSSSSSYELSAGMQRHQDTEAGHQGHERSAAVADERQRHADDREQAHDHARVHAGVHEERERDAAREQAGEGIAALQSHGHAAADDEEVADQQRHEPEQAELLADHREYEVGRALWQELELRLAAVHPALAEHAAGADRDLRLDDVIAGAERVAL